MPHAIFAVKLVPIELPSALDIEYLHNVDSFILSLFPN